MITARSRGSEQAKTLIYFPGSKTRIQQQRTVIRFVWRLRASNPRNRVNGYVILGKQEVSCIRWIATVPA
jgi:hypothetical protein